MLSYRTLCSSGTAMSWPWTEAMIETL